MLSLQADIRLRSSRRPGYPSVRHAYAPACSQGLRPYRFVLMPLIEHILKLERDEPARQIAVLVPELVARHWWQTPLHNQRAQLLKLLLLLRGNQRIVVINIPWYL